MKLMPKTFRGLEVVVRSIEYLAAAILAVATLNVFFGGVLRYFFNIGIPDSNDFGKMMLGIVAFCGIGAIGLRAGHIVVTALADLIPGIWGRLVVKLADVITCGAMAVLAWTLFVKALAARQENLTSYDLGAPLWGFYLVAAIGLGIGTFAFAFAILTGRGLQTHPVGESDETTGVNL